MILLNKIKKEARELQKLSKNYGYNIKYNHALEIITNKKYHQSWHAFCKSDYVQKREEHYQSIQNKQKVKELKEQTIPNKDLINLFDKEYIKNSKNGLFQNKMALGLSVNYDHKKVTKDIQLNMVELIGNNNTLLIGNKFSGKTTAIQFILLSWIMEHGHQDRINIVDTNKMVSEYKGFLKLPKVSLIKDNSGISNLINDLYTELITRKELVSKSGSKNIIEYEKNTGKSLNRIITVFEDLHEIMDSVMYDFDKSYNQDESLSYKFTQIMRLGELFGLLTLGSSIGSTKGFIPAVINQAFNHKLVFKTSKVESAYSTNGLNSYRIKDSEKGKCFSEIVEIYFPKLDNNKIIKLLKINLK